MAKQAPRGSGGGPLKRRRKRKATRTPHDTAISPSVTASIKVSHEREQKAREAAVVADANAKGIAKARNQLRSAETAIGEIMEFCQGRFPDMVPPADAGRIAKPLVCVLRWSLELQARISRQKWTPDTLLNLLKTHLPLASREVLQEAIEFAPDFAAGELMPAVSIMLGVTVAEVDRHHWKHLQPTNLNAEEMAARRRAARSAQRKAQRAARSPDQVEADRIKRRKEDAASKAEARADIEARHKAGRGFIAEAVGVSTEAVRKWQMLGRDRLLLNMAKRIGLDEAERILLQHEVAKKLQEDRVALGKTAGARLQEDRVALGAQPAAASLRLELHEERVALIEEDAATRSSRNLAGDEPGRAESPSPASTAITSPLPPTETTDMDTTRTAPFASNVIPFRRSAGATLAAGVMTGAGSSDLNNPHVQALLDQSVKEFGKLMISEGRQQVEAEISGRHAGIATALAAAMRHRRYQDAPRALEILAAVVGDATRLLQILHVLGDAPIADETARMAIPLIASGKTAREVGAAMLAAAGQPSALQ